jgi:hypothetical protein
MFVLRSDLGVLAVSRYFDETLSRFPLQGYYCCCQHYGQGLMTD